mgnify:CR=1 FL=1
MLKLDMKILIVDDKASIRSAMKKILTGLGLVDITQAEDGQQAWQAIESGFDKTGDNPFDLVISDMEMPKMSGLELLRAIRSHRSISAIPFIMATTVTAKEIILQTMQLGVQAYIIKPFDSATVELKLKQAGIL